MRLNKALTGAIACALGAVCAARAAAVHPHLYTNWVGTWTAMPQLTESTNLPPSPYNGTSGVFNDSTIRQTFRITKGGDTFRLRLSNAFAPTPINLDITGVTVARPAANRTALGTPEIDTKTLKSLTFSGLSSFSVPDMALVVSDPIDLSLNDGDAVTVSVYLKQGQDGFQITSHPGSRVTSYITSGDQTKSANVTDAVAIDHWYFISAAEVVPKRQDAAAFAILGDSITDGRGSTTNGNNRWPDQLFTRLQQHGGPQARVSILNQAAGGNRVLADGLGPNAVSRVDRDILSQTGVKWVGILEGVNDIGVAPATDAAQRNIVTQLIAAYEQIIERVHAHNLPIYAGTITPFGKNAYNDPAGLRERSRQAVNNFIRDSGRFDAVIDFDKAVRDPQNPIDSQAQYDVGDGLHFNPAGYKAFADAVPLELFA